MSDFRVEKWSSKRIRRNVSAQTFVQQGDGLDTPWEVSSPHCCLVDPRRLAVGSLHLSTTAWRQWEAAW